MINKIANAKSRINQNERIDRWVWVRWIEWRKCRVKANECWKEKPTANNGCGKAFASIFIFANKCKWVKNLDSFKYPVGFVCNEWKTYFIIRTYATWNIVAIVYHIYSLWSMCDRANRRRTIQWKFRIRTKARKCLEFSVRCAKMSERVTIVNNFNSKLEEWETIGVPCKTWHPVFQSSQFLLYNMYIWRFLLLRVCFAFILLNAIRFIRFQ